MRKMKKDLLFAIPMILIAVALCMLKLTGMTAHIVISFVGVAVLVVYAIATKKDWKCPALEIIMRVLYAISLIIGIIIMNIHGIFTLSIIHKISAVLSFILFVALLVHKTIKSK